MVDRFLEDYADKMEASYKYKGLYVAKEIRKALDKIEQLEAENKALRDALEARYLFESKAHSALGDETIRRLRDLDKL